MKKRWKCSIICCMELLGVLACHKLQTKFRIYTSRCCCVAAAAYEAGCCYSIAYCCLLLPHDGGGRENFFYLASHDLSEGNDLSHSSSVWKWSNNRNTYAIPHHYSDVIARSPHSNTTMHHDTTTTTEW